MTMKFPNYFFLLPLLVLLAACGSSKEKKVDNSLQQERMAIMMSKAWKYDRDAIYEMVDFSQMSPQQAQIIEQTATVMSLSTIRFLPDSIMTVILDTGDRLQGWWGVAEDGSTVTLQATIRKTPPMVVEEFSENRIVLNNHPDEGFYYPKVLVPALDLREPSGNASSPSQEPGAQEQE